MADNTDDTTKDILQHLSTKSDGRRRSEIKICGSGRDRNLSDTAEEVGLDWTHPQEASIQHHTPSPDLGPSGEEEETPASQHQEAWH